MEQPFATTSDPHHCVAPRSMEAALVGSIASFVDSRENGHTMAVPRQGEQLLRVSQPPLSLVTNRVHHDTGEFVCRDSTLERISIDAEECESIDAKKMVQMVQPEDEENVQLNAERKYFKLELLKPIPRVVMEYFKLESQKKSIKDDLEFIKLLKENLKLQKRAMEDCKNIERELKAKNKQLKKELNAQKMMHAKVKKHTASVLKKLVKEVNAIRDFPTTPQPLRLFRKVNGRTHQVFREWRGGVETSWTVPAELVRVHLNESEAWAQEEQLRRTTQQLLELFVHPLVVE